MSLDSPHRTATAVDTPDDPLTLFRRAVETRMRGRTGKTPHLLVSGPWNKTGDHLGNFREVRVWRGDKGGPRARVTIVTVKGEDWYATFPPVAPYGPAEPPVRRERVGADLGPFIDALMTECEPRAGRV